MLPPGPVLPTPTSIEMDPLIPPPEAPVLIFMSPVLPTTACPVFIVMPPLVPALLAAAVSRIVCPLTDNSLKPEDNFKIPPVAFVLFPAIIDNEPPSVAPVPAKILISPDSAVFEFPVVMDTEPELPVEESPVVIAIEPELGASGDAILTLPDTVLELRPLLNTTLPPVADALAPA